MERLVRRPDSFTGARISAVVFVEDEIDFFSRLDDDDDDGPRGSSESELDVLRTFECGGRAAGVCLDGCAKRRASS